MKVLEITTWGNKVDHSDLLSDSSFNYGDCYVTATGYTKEKKKTLRKALRDTDLELIGTLRANIECGHYMTKVQGHKLNDVVFEYNALDLAKALNRQLGEEFTHVKVKAFQLHGEYKTLYEKTLSL